MARQYYKLKQRRSKGVPAGYFEDWKYVGRWKERKLKKGLWMGRFRATKKRMQHVRGFGSFGVGTRLRWKIFGYQDAIKVAKDKYLTDYKFFKKPVYVIVRKPKRKYR